MSAEINIEVCVENQWVKARGVKLSKDDKGLLQEAFKTAMETCPAIAITLDNFRSGIFTEQMFRIVRELERIAFVYDVKPCNIKIMVRKNS